MIYILGALLVYIGVSIVDDFAARVILIGGGIVVVFMRLLYIACKQHVIRCPKCKAIFSVMQKKGFHACPICGMPISFDINKNK